MNNVENGGFFIGDVVEFIDKIKKMSWKTDLESIKTIVSAFLYIDVDKTPFSPMVVQHPIFESGIQCVKNDDGEMELINILESGENLERARRNISSLVEQAKTLNDLYMIIRKSYRLTFIRYAQDDLSLEDMSKLLRHAWTSSENPNDDVNVSLPMAISWFRRADKSFLMDEEDYNTYQSFGDETKVYRGVAVGRNPHGLSWTTDKSKAHWFAHRFDIEDKQGYIQSLVVKKDDILAYFSDRDESEVVVDTLKYLNEIEVVEE